MNRAGDDGMEPTTDAVEAVQPDKDALLIAELRLALREYYVTIGNMPAFATANDYIRVLRPLQQHASELLGDAQLGGKEEE